jgi:hypothetical protein
MQNTLLAMIPAVCSTTGNWGNSSWCRAWASAMKMNQSNRTNELKRNDDLPVTIGVIGGRHNHVSRTLVVRVDLATEKRYTNHHNIAPHS